MGIQHNKIKRNKKLKAQYCCEFYAVKCVCVREELASVEL